MIKPIFLFLICYIPIISNYLPATKFGPGIPDIGPANFTGFLLLALFFLQGCTLKNIKIINKWVSIILIYCLVVFASVYWSTYKYNSYILQLMFYKVFMLLFVSIIAINLLTDKRTIHQFIINIALAGAILSAVSILQMISGFLMGSHTIRATGTFAKPNGLAIYLVMIFPCLLYAIEKKILSTTVIRIVTVLIVFGIICTVSKKGIATMILSVFIYNLLKGRVRQLLVTSVCFVLLAIALSGYKVISQRFEHDTVEKQINTKWSMTNAGWEMFKTSPIIGLGFRGFSSHYATYITNTQKDAYDAHNIFITLLSDYGLLGFLPFMGILLYPMGIAIRILRMRVNNKDPSNDDLNFSKDMSVIYIAVVIPFMISGWFAGGLLFREEIMYLLFTLMAMFIAYVERQKRVAD